MRINTNVNAMIATNQMSKNTALSGASMEKLSTGLRITKAADDATGCVTPTAISWQFGHIS